MLKGIPLTALRTWRCVRRDWRNGHENGALAHPRKARQKKARSAHATPPCIQRRIFFHVARPARSASDRHVSLFGPARQARVTAAHNELARAVFSDIHGATLSWADKASRG